jgi:aldehyde:ferredoxin oxidoreductase
MEKNQAKKILEVNLAEKTLKEVYYNGRLIKKYLGGPGIAIHYMMKNKLYKYAPLTEENPLILMTGLLTGTSYPCSGFYSVSARSPLTNIYGEGLSGGFFGAELRPLYDGIIFLKKSDNPVYLYIDDESVELRDASEIWGKDTKKTSKILNEKLGKGFKIATIGPSGENLIPLGAILNDHGRAVGRAGMGAAMGSKKLKAIAVNSNKKVEYQNEKEFNKITRMLFKEFSKSAMATTMKQIGTNGINYFEIFGDVPHQNWGEMARWKGVNDISGGVVAEKLMVRLRPCYLCPFSCGREVKVDKEPYIVENAAGPEYETVGAFGSMCLNSNIESIAYINDYCNRMGVDTISTGCTVAFAMNCYNQGIITEDDLGFKLEWGDADAIIKLTKLICENKGIGKIFSRGSREAAKLIGKGAENYTAEIKGLELPMHEPRTNYPLGLQYATSNRGACHLRGFGSDIYSGFSNLSSTFNIKESIPIKLRAKDDPKFASDIAISQNLSEINNSLGVCRQTFSSGSQIVENIFELLADTIFYLTGIRLTVSELAEIGERIFNLKRIYNVHCGISKKDDYIPIKLKNSPLNAGKAKNRIISIDDMLMEYYNFRGWDNNGIPTREKLNELGIEEYYIPSK